MKMQPLNRLLASQCGNEKQKPGGNEKQRPGGNEILNPISLETFEPKKFITKSMAFFIPEFIPKSAPQSRNFITTLPTNSQHCWASCSFCRYALRCSCSFTLRAASRYALRSDDALTPWVQHGFLKSRLLRIRFPSAKLPKIKLPKN